MTVAVTLLVTRDTPARAKAVPLINVGLVPNSKSTSHITSRPAAGSQTGMPIPDGSHLVLDRVHVDAPIVNVGLDGRVMQVPRDPGVVGWWNAGARPGADHGSVVIVGHINYAGVSGALSALPLLRPGDLVRLREEGTTFKYRIVAVHSYPKATGLPSDVFSKSGDPRLVLITCGGSFDSTSGNYVDNIVGYAEPA